PTGCDQQQRNEGEEGLSHGDLQRKRVRLRRRGVSFVGAFAGPALAGYAVVERGRVGRYGEVQGSSRLDPIRGTLGQAIGQHENVVVAWLWVTGDIGLRLLDAPLGVGNEWLSMRRLGVPVLVRMPGAVTIETDHIPAEYGDRLAAQQSEDLQCSGSRPGDLL